MTGIESRICDAEKIVLFRSAATVESGLLLQHEPELAQRYPPCRCNSLNIREYASFLSGHAKPVLLRRLARQEGRTRARVPTRSLPTRYIYASKCQNQTGFPRCRDLVSLHTAKHLMEQQYFDAKTAFPSPGTRKSFIPAPPAAVYRPPLSGQEP